MVAGATLLPYSPRPSLLTSNFFWSSPFVNCTSAFRRQTAYPIEPARTTQPNCIVHISAVQIKKRCVANTTASLPQANDLYSSDINGSSLCEAITRTRNRKRGPSTVAQPNLARAGHRPCLLRTPSPRDRVSQVRIVIAFRACPPAIVEEEQGEQEEEPARALARLCSVG